MTRQQLIDILKHWISFHGKKFYGETDSEQHESKRIFIEEFYDSFHKWEAEDLTKAFRACKEKYDYFPRTSQLYKERPHRPTETHQDKMPEHMPVPDSVRAQMNKKPVAWRIGKANMDKMKHIIRHHPTLGQPAHLVDKTFARWEEENEKRPQRK